MNFIMVRKGGVVVDRYGEITDKMRAEWLRKVGVISQAVKLARLSLNADERRFIRGAVGIIIGRGLSFRQSSWLTKIYNRIE